MWSTSAIILTFIVLIVVLFITWVWWVKTHIYVLDPATGGFSSHEKHKKTTLSITMIGHCMGNQCKDKIKQLIHKPAVIHTEQFGTISGKVVDGVSPPHGMKPGYAAIEVELDAHSAKVVGTTQYKFNTKDTMAIYV